MGKCKRLAVEVEAVEVGVEAAAVVVAVEARKKNLIQEKGQRRGNR